MHATIKSGAPYAGRPRQRGDEQVTAGTLLAPESARVHDLLRVMLDFFNDGENLRRIHIVELAIYAHLWMVSEH